MIFITKFEILTSFSPQRDCERYTFITEIKGRRRRIRGANTSHWYNCAWASPEARRHAAVLGRRSVQGCPVALTFIHQTFSCFVYFISRSCANKKLPELFTKKSYSNKSKLTNKIVLAFFSWGGTNSFGLPIGSVQYGGIRWFHCKTSLFCSFSLVPPFGIYIEGDRAVVRVLSS